jgi:regulator of sigma E protease
MSYVLAFAGFAALIILHELGHFMAAKAVGMRVERFSLFFPPFLARVRRGETEYAVGSIPLGGYVRITGMNPREELPAEVESRAYYRQPVWKRVVVISAGPGMNILIALVILWALFLAHGTQTVTHRIDKVDARQPAAHVLQRGDVVVTVDGRDGDVQAITERISSHRCVGPARAGCEAKTPVRIGIRRDGRLRTFSITPRYDPQAKRMRLGFAFAVDTRDAGPVRAAGLSVRHNWAVAKLTVKAIARVFYSSQARKQVSGVVGSYEVTRESIAFDSVQALNVLAIISLSLAIVNLFPFLPLDGGHIFWALAEKVRRRPIPYTVLERVSVIGFMLVIFLFVVGLTNDIDRLRGEGFGIR